MTIKEKVGMYNRLSAFSFDVLLSNKFFIKTLNS